MSSGIEKLLIRCPFLRNLLHKLFAGNELLLNQELRQCVSLRKTGDDKFFQREQVFYLVLPL
jgi:hypothetical protein